MTTINFSHNVEQVINDIDDVQDDLHDNLLSNLDGRMRSLRLIVSEYVQDDPNYRARLLNSIYKDVDDQYETITFEVGADGEKAPWAPLVEFGTGTKTNVPWEGSEPIPPAWPDVGSSVPVGFPYESPDIPFNRDDPLDTSGFSQFYGFVGHIMDWMEKKGIPPKLGDQYVSAVYITKEIIEEGQHAHPFLRPAWYDMELNIKKAASHAVSNATR